MSSYQFEGWFDNLFWGAKGDANKIVSAFSSKMNIPKSSAQRIYNTVFPIYIEGVKGGKFPAYDVTKANFSAIAAKVADLSRYPKGDVSSFLQTIYSLAMSQEISMTNLDPTVPGRVKQDIVEETATGAKEKVKKAFREITGTAGEGIKNILAGVPVVPVVIGLAALGLIVYYPTISAALSRKRK